MKKRIKRHCWTGILWGVLLPVLWSACNGQEEAKEDYGEKIAVDIVLEQPQELTVEGKSARASVAGITISNIWVAQFNADAGNACLANKYYDTGIAQDGDFKALVSTTEKDFSNTESRFYIIVNAGSAFLTQNDLTLTEAGLKSKAIVTKSPFYSKVSEPVYLVAGPISFTPKKGSEGDAATKAALVAPLERPYTRLIFKYTSPTKGSFIPTALNITNLPNSVYVCKGTGVFPETNEVNEATTAAWKTADGDWSATAALTCYIGENLRGSGTSTTMQGKGVTGNGPAGNLTGCTYITLTGNYKYDSGHTNGVTVTYKIYLGGNLINDYNLQRNTQYTYTIHIGGANSADVRVTVSDGNVGYFQDVQELTPEYTVEL